MTRTKTINGFTLCDCDQCREQEEKQKLRFFDAKSDSSDRPYFEGREAKQKNVLALGYQSPDGLIIVTDVLCVNFPPATDDQVASLSRKLSQLASVKAAPRP